MESLADAGAIAPDADRNGHEEVTSGNAVFYLNGRHNQKTKSSVLVSSSPWLNDARVREWISTENLRRNGADYPLLYGMPPLLEAIIETRDYDLIDSLAAEERKINRDFDRWLDAHFVSTYDLEALGKNPEGSIGRLVHDYMVEFDLSPQLSPQIIENPDWKPRSFIDYWDLRMGQTHDFYHILGEVGFSTVAEYFITGFVTGNVFKHVSPKLAGYMMTTNTLIMFPWMTRCMLHYGEAWPTLWHHLTHGYRMGQQSDKVFMARFEDVMHLPPAEAREALGMRGFEGVIDSVPAAMAFGEGRLIL